MSTTSTTVRELLVPLDGSATSERGLRVAAALARPLGATVAALGVVTTDDEVASAAEDLRARAASADVEAGVDVVVGTDCASTIVDAAASRDGAILCLATDGHGHGSHALLGSVATALVRRSTAPLLLVGPHADRDGAPSRVILCLDGSDLAESAAAPAHALARQLGVSLVVVQVVAADAAAASDVPDAGYVEHHAKALGADVAWEVLHGGDAAEAILDWLGDDATSITAVATHGHSGISQLVLGSVAAGVVHGSRGPVLVVPAPRSDPE